MKSALIIILFALLSITPAAYGITTVDKSYNKSAETGTTAPITREDKMLLLNWQGDYLRTTKGVIFIKGVVVENLSGVGKAALNRTNKLSEVQLVRSGDVIRKVRILAAE